ncbi:30S ribosomal protein S17 [Candidatus Deianiraea vastatrix]|uniref:30S ribosomal protein S17 n=1 Tax=Candidatus Deianiraea vastatrix TaxID=2163644 RepID=A0A5B8XH80_9RICK|nr:30S ribosomal protein S17 [Candidatus Deianiraea vastatrix]QED23197.1 30S ribosomal protein S17 [Candidatus Deianiraea vastatrix]
MVLNFDNKTPLFLGSVSKVIDIATVKVACVRRVVHMTGKIRNIRFELLCHANGSSFEIGDEVKVYSTRPISKMKKFCAVKVHC